MGIAIAVIGGLVALIGLAMGLGAEPESAPQQAVAALYYVIGVLGIAIVGLGCILHQIEALRRRVALAAPGADLLAPPPGSVHAVPGPAPIAESSRFEAGARVRHATHGVGVIAQVFNTWALVKFDKGDPQPINFTELSPAWRPHQ